MHIFNCMSIEDKIVNKFAINNKLIIFGIGFAITLYITTVIGLIPLVEAITSDITNGHNIQVKVGGGNITYPLFGYNPQKIQIHVGDSVTWTGVSQMEEPHTVTFVNDKTLNTAPDVPFMVSNSSLFTPVPSNANSQPTIMPSNSSSSNNINKKPIVIVGANERANLATLIDKNGHVIMLNPSKPVVIDGTEKFINSGIIVAKKFVDIYPGSTDSFTIKFDKPGTYDYICIYHYTMGGQVVVK